MAYTTVNKSSLNQNSILYTGNSSTQSISGVGFQPGFTWIKDRIGSSAVYSHYLFDAVRGATKWWKTNSTDTESTTADTLTSFDVDGFSLGANAKTNASGDGIVSWNWKANGAGSTNTDGDNPNTVTVSANATAGFSIIKYQGTDTGGQTIGHGLGVKPALFITKNISEADNGMTWWDTTRDGSGAVRLLTNSTNNDYGNYPVTFNTSTITLPSTSDNAWNGNGDNFISYAFANVRGYQRIGVYTGTGNNDGQFIYTGFKVKYFLIKSASANEQWEVVDNKRDPYNPVNQVLVPNDSAAETTATTSNRIYCDFLSNGVKLRGNASSANGSGSTYVYLAIGQTMVGTNDIPATGF